MASLTLRAITAILACTSVSPAWAGSQATASIGVSLISSAEASAKKATELLFSPTPGVLKITIPGSSGSTVDLTATGAEGGVFTFTAASGTSATAMNQLIQQLSGALSGSLTNGLTISGFINGQGVQIVVVAANPDADGGTLQATIAFD
jgi:hypothetical protein